MVDLKLSHHKRVLCVVFKYVQAAKQVTLVHWVPPVETQQIILKLEINHLLCTPWWENITEQWESRHKESRICFARMVIKSTQTGIKFSFNIDFIVIMQQCIMIFEHLLFVQHKNNRLLQWIIIINELAILKILPFTL